MQTTALIAIPVLALVGPWTQANGQPGPARTVLEHCRVYLIDDVEVPALEAGPLVTIHVRQGNHVQQGQPLAQIDDRQAQLQKLAAELERDAAQQRADDDIEVRYAIKSFELAEAELAQDIEINRKSPGSVPETEIRRKQLAKHRAELQIDRTQLDMKVAQITADVQNSLVLAADDSIRRRRIVAPFDGMVVEVLREAAEFVNAGEAVVRVVRMDRLRVDGFLDGNQYNPAEVANCAVTVEISLAQGRKGTFQGQVTHVSPLVQVGNQYRLEAEVSNRNEQGQPLLRPGMTATMVIHLR